MESFFKELEEIANAITHGFGLAISIIGFIFLSLFSFNYSDLINVILLHIYGFSLISTYTASTFYHSIKDIKLKETFRLIDHISIYLLIAGSYMPFVSKLPFFYGLSLFLLIWVCAFSGIYYKVFSENKFTLFSSIPYIFMGWAVIIFAHPILNSLYWYSILPLFIGGIFYTGGFYFYMKDEIPFFHSIWHLFVLAGSIAHYGAVLTVV